MTKKSKSSRAWLNEHHGDPYVQRARSEGYRSRAAYKLLEIQARDKLLKPGMCVVDLGAAPGGWVQVAVDAVGKQGKVFGLDLLPMDAIVGADFLQGDFREEAVIDAFQARLSGVSVDVVLSDMAPNISGNAAIDQPRAMYLVDLALDFAFNNLKKGGDMLVKVFQGTGSEAYKKQMREHFDAVAVRKPKSSRARSNEVYFLARGFKGLEN